MLKSIIDFIISLFQNELVVQWVSSIGTVGAVALSLYYSHNREKIKICFEVENGENEGYNLSANNYSQVPVSFKLEKIAWVNIPKKANFLQRKHSPKTFLNNFKMETKFGHLIRLNAGQTKVIKLCTRSEIDTAVLEQSRNTNDEEKGDRYFLFYIDVLGKKKPFIVDVCVNEFQRERAHNQANYVNKLSGENK